MKIWIPLLFAFFRVAYGETYDIQDKSTPSPDDKATVTIVEVSAAELPVPVQQEMPGPSPETPEQPPGPPSHLIQITAEIHTGASFIRWRDLGTGEVIEAWSDIVWSDLQNMPTLVLNDGEQIIFS